MLLDKQYSYRSIARILRRSVSSISDEVRRNSVNGIYDPDKAHSKASTRRKAARYQGKKIVANKALCLFIETALLQRQSPEAIAGRLRKGLEPGLPYVSRDTIETYVSSVHGRQLEHRLKLLKAGQRRRKRRGPPRNLTSPKGDLKKSIDERPAVIVNRERVGDLEVDFIVSGKHGSGYCLTAADRKLRVGFIRKILPVTVGNALKALQDIQKHFPEIQSITTDNDILWQYHRKLEEALGVPFYFCYPYASWQKGGIENYNGEVRTYVPKGSDISQYGETYLHMAEDKLNNRYMKVLGYKTPHEALRDYRETTPENCSD